MEYTIIYVLLVSLTVYAMNYVVYYIILCPLGWSVTSIHSYHSTPFKEMNEMERTNERIECCEVECNSFQLNWSGL